MAGGKSKKKKWAKGKVKEKLANMVMFDKATYDKLMKEIPKAERTCMRSVQCGAGQCGAGECSAM